MSELGRVVIGAAAIARRVESLGAEVRRAFSGETLDFVVVLEGGRRFAEDLSRAVGPEIHVRTHFVRAESYGAGTTSDGNVRVNGDLTLDLAGSRVLVVDDIVDSGHTAQALLERLALQRPRSLSLAALLHKPARTVIDIPIDFLGFSIPDEFVVGYGMDCAGAFRDLPDIRVLGEPCPLGVATTVR